jgi:hypothetical protein
MWVEMMALTVSAGSTEALTEIDSSIGEPTQIVLVSIPTMTPIGTISQMKP